MENYQTEWSFMTPSGIGEMGYRKRKKEHKKTREKKQRIRKEIPVSDASSSCSSPSDYDHYNSPVRITTQLYDHGKWWRSHDDDHDYSSENDSIESDLICNGECLPSREEEKDKTIPSYEVDEINGIKNAYMKFINEHKEFEKPQNIFTYEKYYNQHNEIKLDDYNDNNNNNYSHHSEFDEDDYHDSMTTMMEPKIKYSPVLFDDTPSNGVDCSDSNGSKSISSESLERKKLSEDKTKNWKNEDEEANMFALWDLHHDIQVMMKTNTADKEKMTDVYYRFFITLFNNIKNKNTKGVINHDLNMDFSRYTKLMLHRFFIHSRIGKCFQSRETKGENNEQKTINNHEATGYVNVINWPLNFNLRKAYEITVDVLKPFDFFIQENEINSCNDKQKRVESKCNMKITFSSSKVLEEMKTRYHLKSLTPRNFAIWLFLKIWSEPSQSWIEISNQDCFYCNIHMLSADRFLLTFKITKYPYALSKLNSLENVFSFELYHRQHLLPIYCSDRFRITK